MDFRYQKNLTFQLLFENQSVFDGNLIDDRANASNPGGTDVFGRAASTENPGFRVERFWMRYQFAGTPVTLFVGAELKKVSQAGIFGNDDPGIGVEVEFGNLELSAKAYIERESQRLGLENDNDLVNYVFTAELQPGSRTASGWMWCGFGTASWGRTRRRWGVTALTSGVRGRRATVCGLTPVGRGGSGRCARCCKAT